MFFNNSRLEKDFARYYHNLVQNMLSEDPKLGKASSTFKSTLEFNEWQQWILRHLDNYVLRVSGNESINLIAGLDIKYQKLTRQGGMDLVRLLVSK